MIANRIKVTKYIFTKALFQTGAGIGGDTAAVVYGIKCMTSSFHAVGLFIPFPIEFFMILWDINHDWADHKKTRIITGMNCLFYVLEYQTPYEAQHMFRHVTKIGLDLT